MGMFDSVYMKCINCGHVIEFQSKTGLCILNSYNKSNVPTIVAIGINGDIIRCKKCRKNIIVKVKPTHKLKLKITKKRCDYEG